jgi:DNA-directed RNA polymerase subunit RPC12/RpoP
VANARFETTYSFSRHRADCRIVCPCGYVRLVTAVELQRAFPMPTPINMAEKRLKCSKCGAKGARMVPVPMPGR